MTCSCSTSAVSVFRPPLLQSISRFAHSAMTSRFYLFSFPFSIIMLLAFSRVLFRSFLSSFAFLYSSSIFLLCMSPPLRYHFILVFQFPFSSSQLRLVRLPRLNSGAIILQNASFCTALASRTPRSARPCQGLATRTPRSARSLPAERLVLLDLSCSLCVSSCLFLVRVFVCVLSPLLPILAISLSTLASCMA